jgi:hypothetical protein
MFTLDETFFIFGLINHKTSDPSGVILPEKTISFDVFFTIRYASQKLLAL